MYIKTVNVINCKLNGEKSLVLSISIRKHNGSKTKEQESTNFKLDVEI